MKIFQPAIKRGDDRADEIYVEICGRVRGVVFEGFIRPEEERDLVLKHYRRGEPLVCWRSRVVEMDSAIYYHKGDR